MGGRKRRAKRRDGRLARLDTWVKVVGGVIAIVVALLGLPKAVLDALGHGDSKAAAAERRLDRVRTQLAQTGPVLDASYVFLSQDVYPPEALAKGTRAGLLLAYPVQGNRWYREPSTSSPPAACKLHARYVDTSVAYLVIENRGRRDAADITVVGRSLRLRRAVSIDESRSRIDYVARLEAASRATRTATIEVPLTLAPGEGIRIPLWTSASAGAYSAAPRWCVVPPTAFEPVAVRFVDSMLAAHRRLAVRRMRDAVLLANGVVGRG